MSSRSMTCKQASGGHPQDDNEDNQNACSAVVALQKVGHLDQFPFIENPVPPPPSSIIVSRGIKQQGALNG